VSSASRFVRELPSGWHAEGTTLLFADVVESTRLLAADEGRNAWRIQALLDDLVRLACAGYAAELLEHRGDGLLLRWAGHEREAARCALAMAGLVHGRAQAARADEAVQMRFGLHRGEVLSDGQRVYGSQVALAARVATLAQPGEVVVSQAVRDHLVPGLDGEVADMGECWVKHAAEPVRAYRLGSLGSGVGHARAGAGTALPDTAPPLPCIAVLPFRPIGLDGGSEQAGVLELIGENLVHALSLTDQLAVVSWFSTRSLSCEIDSTQALRSRLGASWWVSGSCARFGDRLVIGVELLDAQTDAVAWTARVSTSLGDLMCAEPAFAAELAQGLVQRLCEAEARRLARHALPNLASHSILTGAIGLMHRSTRDSFMKSREALEYLLERHPRLHAVQPWLAQWYVLKNTRGFGQEPEQDAARALDHTHRALDALPEDGRALALLGFTHFHLRGDTGTAERHLDLALQANPNDPLALIFAAAIKAALAKADQGRQLSISALRIAPFDPLRDYMLGIAAGCLLSSGAADEARRMAEQSVRGNAAHPYAWRVLLFACAQLGEIERARQAHQQLQRLGLSFTVAGYRARSKLAAADLANALSALRAVGVPEH